MKTEGYMKCVCIRDCSFDRECFIKGEVFWYHNWLMPNHLIFFSEKKCIIVSMDDFYRNFDNLNNMRRKKIKKLNESSLYK